MSVKQIFESKMARLNGEPAALAEARQEGVEYTEKLAKGAVDRVTAQLLKNQSVAWNRLSKQYAELDQSMKDLIEQRDRLNSDLKLKATDLFDLEDEVLTRVIETSKLTITLSKKSFKPASTKVDNNAVVQDLLNADLVPALKKMVDKLIKTHTSVVDASEVPEKMSVKVNEGVVDSVKQFITRAISALRGMFDLFDQRFDKLQLKVAAL